MLKLKTEGDKPAKVKGLGVEILLAIIIAKDLLAEMFDGLGLVITCGSDSHEDNMKSLHNWSRAFDMRSRDIPEPKQKNTRDYANELESRLGNEYDVVVERRHIHIEFQPK